MAPKTKIDRDDIIAGAFSLVRECGEGALNARTLAKRLGVSTQPIFSNFTAMSELRAEVIEKALNLYMKETEELMASNKYPQYKATGMAYINFAKNEHELFKLLFMRDRSNDLSDDEAGFDKFQKIIGIVRNELSLTEAQANDFHFNMWVYVHGIATMAAIGFLDIDEQTVSSAISHVYRGMCMACENEKKIN